MLDLSLLVLACIASNDERDIPASLGFPLQLCCITSSPMLTGMLVLALCLLYDSLLGVLVFGCVARCIGLGDGGLVNRAVSKLYFV